MVTKRLRLSPSWWCWPRPSLCFLCGGDL